MINVLSTSVATPAVSNSTVIPKPSGLAVGDLMIAQTWGGGTVSPPSGWNLILNTDIVGDNTPPQSFFYKIANASDVVATDFTFTATTQLYCGGILRITGYDSITPVGNFDLDTDVNTETPIFSDSVTPTLNDSLILFTVSTKTNNTNIKTASGYAIANDNPSWSEAWDTGVVAGGNGYMFSLAYAIRPQITATGNSTVTMSGGGSSVDLTGVLMVVNPGSGGLPNNSNFFEFF